MKSRRLSFVSAFIAVIMIFSVFTTGCSGNNKDSSPSAPEYFEKILQVNFGDVEFFSQTSKANIKINPSEGLPIPELGSSELTVYSGPLGESMLFANANYKGSDIDAEIYSLGEGFILSSSLIGNTPIGITLSDLQALAGIYAPAPYDTSEPSSGSLNNILGMIESFITLNADDIYTILERYLDIFNSSSEKATENMVSFTDNAVNVTFKFNCDSSKKIIKDVFNVAKKDKELKNLFNAFLAFAEVPEEEKDELISAYEDFFKSSDTLDSIFAEMNKYSFAIELSIDTDALLNINKAAVIINVNGSRYEVQCNLSKPNSAYISYIEDTSTGMDGHNEINLEIVNDDSLFHIGLTQNSVQLFKFDVNTQDESLVISSASFRDKLNIYGNAVISENKIEAKLNSIEFKNESKPLDIEINVETGVQLPTVPTNFKSIMSFTPNELGALIENLTSHPVIGKLFPQTEGEIFGDEI